MNFLEPLQNKLYYGLQDTRFLDLEVAATT